MKHIFLGCLCAFAAFTTHAQTPIGTWITYDEQTGRKNSLIKIYTTQGNELCGDVEAILVSGKENTPCVKCPGNKKNQPIKGMTIIWGLERNGSEWSGGHILDPQTGNTYKCHIQLKGQNQLQVRGYLGIRLIGRTQIWKRLSTAP